jgi:acyl-CoA thioesterase I
MKLFRYTLRTATVLIVVFILNFYPANAQIIKAKKYKEVIRVACVGNSITYGAGIENRDSLSYPVQLGRLLGNKWDVRNFGVSGRTLLSKGDRPYNKEKAYTDAKDFQPHIVLIKLGTNDTKPQNWQYKNEFLDNYKALVQSFQQLESKPIVVLLKAVPAFPERWGISDSLIHGEVNPMVEQLAKEMKLPFIDLHAPLENHAEMFPDLIHPNADGAAIMAKVIYEGLTHKKKAGKNKSRK